MCNASRCKWVSPKSSSKIDGKSIHTQTKIGKNVLLLLNKCNTRCLSTSMNGRFSWMKPTNKTKCHQRVLYKCLVAFSLILTPFLSPSLSFSLSLAKLLEDSVFIVIFCVCKTIFSLLLRIFSMRIVELQMFSFSFLFPKWHITVNKIGGNGRDFRLWRRTNAKSKEDNSSNASSKRKWTKRTKISLIFH